jgi:orotate phosphoribosyltransferase-like protein
MKVDWLEYDSKIIELINDGLSYTKIGDMIKLSRERVRKRTTKRSLEQSEKQQQQSCRRRRPS